MDSVAKSVTKTLKITNSEKRPMNYMILFGMILQINILRRPKTKTTRNKRYSRIPSFKLPQTSSSLHAIYN